MIMGVEMDICPACTGAGGDNNTFTCATCNGSGGVPVSPSGNPAAVERATATLRELVIQLESLEGDTLSIFRDTDGAKLLRQWIAKADAASREESAREILRADAMSRDGYCHDMYERGWVAIGCAISAMLNFRAQL